MKKIGISVLGFLLLLVPHAWSQSDRSGNARDIYTQYAQNSNGHSAGKPGVKFWIERERSGRHEIVPSNTVFRNGDRVKFHFTVNYPAYVAVLNNASTGRVQLLYPYAGTSARVKPSVRQSVPKGEFWFSFDDNPGEERLTFLMSTRPIENLDQFVRKAGTRKSSAERDLSPSNSLDSLGDLSLAQSRDLNLEYVGNDGYALASHQDLKSVKAFRFSLKHRQ